MSKVNGYLGKLIVLKMNCYNGPIWELKFFDLMVRHHAGVVSENNKRGWNFANSHIYLSNIKCWDALPKKGFFYTHAAVLKAYL